MQAALGLASRGLGQVWPNPAVGCVLVREDLGGSVVGRGWTQPGGRPHAETEAISRAGELSRGATAYVTLEPCDHQGQTGPCSQALIDAGIGKVVIACTDPDPRVSGEGIIRLEKCGVEVRTGLEKGAAERLNAGFFSRIIRNRPVVTLKTATSMDGCIATRSGDSQWITGPQARSYGHLLRARHDAILTGIGSILSDNPLLTCRLPGLEGQSPHRVIVDSQLRIPDNCDLVKSAKHYPATIITSDNSSVNVRNSLIKSGVEVIACHQDSQGQIDLDSALQLLSEKGITRLLVEAGAKLTGAFLKGDLVDVIAWFRAPIFIGEDGLSALTSLDMDKLNDAKRYSRLATTRLGDDILDILERQG